MIGGLLLCADYVVTAALSAADAFHYLALAHPHAWAAASIAAIGGINYFGPRRSGTGVQSPGRAWPLKWRSPSCGMALHVAWLVSDL